MSPTSLRPFPAAGSLEPYLDQLAHLIAEHGIGDFEGDIARLVVRLRAAGHDGPLVDVLRDHGQPAVARERAFGILVSQLISSTLDGAGRATATSPAVTVHAA